MIGPGHPVPYSYLICCLHNALDGTYVYNVDQYFIWPTHHCVIVFTMITLGIPRILLEFIWFFSVAWSKTKARVVTAWLADELVSLAQAGDDKLSLVTRCVWLGGCNGGGKRRVHQLTLHMCWCIGTPSFALRMGLAGNSLCCVWGHLLIVALVGAKVVPCTMVWVARGQEQVSYWRWCWGDQGGMRA
jgi:hypothetical protein